MATRIGVTGASGHIGRRVAETLAVDADPLVLVVRDPARAPKLPGTSVRVATYADTAAMRSALEGVDVLLLVSAAESADRVAEHRSAIDAAVASGVRHLVYTSFVAAGSDSTFTLGRDHGATEDAIISSGLEYTFLRDNFYLDLLPEFADADGIIRGPAGEGRVAAVARADVSDAAVAVLRAPGEHRRAIYDLTGREAITLGELASRVTAATGRQLRFVDETIPEAYESRAHYGAPSWQVDAWVSTYTSIRDGDVSRISPDVGRLTGHEARVLEDVL